MRKKIITLTLGVGALLLQQRVLSQVAYTPQQVQQMEMAKQEKANQLKGHSVKSARPEQDCESAILVCQSVYSYTQPYIGAGTNPNEVNPNIGCLGAGEQNSVWYKFRANTGGALNFTITPANANDDYDWALYNITHSSCAEIATSGILQVGCNYSPVPGATGANGAASPQNTSIITITQGDVFVLIVSNFASPSGEGFTLDFTPSTAHIYDTIPPVIINTEYVCDNYGLRLTTDKLMACSTLAADGSDFSAVDNQGNNIQVIGAVGVGCATGEMYTYQVDVMMAKQTSDKEVSIHLQNGTDGNGIEGTCGHSMHQINATALLAAKPNLFTGDDHQTCTYWPYYPQLVATNEWETYQWYQNGNELAGQNTNILQPSEGGIYTVDVSKHQGAVMCHYTDTLVIDVDVKYCENTLPGAFSPNGDGVNDVYLKMADISIMNRWGQTLFEGLGGWDGTYNGLPVENGTYYVLFKYVDGNGDEKTLKESLTLVR